MKVGEDFDYPLLVATLILVGIGLMELFSASAAYAYIYHKGDLYYFLKRQLLWLGPGFIFLWLASRFNYQKYQIISRFLPLFIIILLCAVFLPGIGKPTRGVHRLIGLGPITFTPSEFTKLGLIIYLAFSLVRKKEKMQSYISGSLPYFITLGVISVLVMIEPDLGSALIIAVLAFILLYAGGARISHLAYTVILALIPLSFSIFKIGYQKIRILGFLRPELDPQGIGFHPRHLKISIGSGGLWGLGPGQGKEKLFYLPAPHTDSIFAVIGEELGFIGTSLIIALFFVVALRGLRIARKAPDDLGKLLALGLTCLILVQAIVNMGVATVILPTTGATLPFISYGGSSLIVCLTAVGILLNISKNRDLKNTD
ncbi:putative lipid II flippase FtsW [Candidatus Aerophobetes bacterium]|uniref:Probable peptidoglycan glycosyltransferase FtsW n=1 Tax=Aerophobetes bacterium TaxID=2030807 RepID=A0A523YLG4_UNCAE|nr:MAG: putative lipid II flippase FtsW [Candidatus Aerophobetes bacterium]